MEVPGFSVEGPNKKNAVKICKRCPRRNDSTREVYRSLVFKNKIPGEEGWEYAGDTRQFYGDLGTGLTSDMPVNTKLEDIDHCDKPVVIGRQGLRLVRECGAVICALERLESGSDSISDSD